MKIKELEKIVDENKKPAPQWGFRVSQAIIWNKAMQSATIERFEHNYSKYYRIIDSLIITMFKKDRDEVKEYQKELDGQCEDYLSYYDRLFEKIVDVLEREGYLMVEHIEPDKEEMYRIGRPEDSVLEGDESGQET